MNIFKNKIIYSGGIRISEERNPDGILSFEISNIVTNLPIHGFHHVIKITGDISGKNPFRFIKFQLSSNPSGCGSTILSGYAHSVITTEDRENFKLALLELIPIIALTSGILITTLGQSFYSYQSFLEELGFKEIIEYNNPTHGKNYKQKLLILNLV